MAKGVKITMEEAKRYDVINAVLDGKMTNREASGAVGLSERQIKRLKKKVKSEGFAGVVHATETVLHTVPSLPGIT